MVPAGGGGLYFSQVFFSLNHLCWLLPQTKGKEVDITLNAFLSDRNSPVEFVYLRNYQHLPVKFSA